MWPPLLTLGALATVFVPTAAKADTLGDRSLLQAISAQADGDDTTAFKLLNAVLAQPHSGALWTAARFVATRSALNLGEHSRALSLLADLGQELPEVADFVLMMRGQALRQKLDWDGAKAQWELLLNQWPDSPLASEALYSVADSHLAVEHWRHARAAYRRALRAAPRSPRASVARFNIARIDERLQSWTDAARGYADIVYRRPSDFLAPQAAERLRLLIEAGRAPEPQFQTRLRRIDRLLAHRQLALVEAELTALGPLATTRSHQRALVYRHAQLAYRQQDFDTAIARFTQLVNSSHGIQRQSYELWLARCYSAADRIDEAIEQYLDAAKRHPTRRHGREALFTAAWLAYNGRQHERAIEMFGEFIGRYPTDPAVVEALWYLAWNAYRLDDLSKALTNLDRLVAQFPTSALVPQSHYWRGRIYARLQKHEEARVAYRAARQALPLGYYGHLATQRLRELDAIEAAPRETVVLASLAEKLHSPEPVTHEPTQENGFPPTSLIELPWGAAALDWQNPRGRRALRLITLGLHRHAAALVRDLPEVPGYRSNSVAYARARLLLGLGDYHAAYRIAAVAFRANVESQPEGDSLRYFQLAYPTAYMDLVHSAASEFGVSPLLILAIMRQESAFVDRARSWAAAQGLMQIIPPTGERIAEALEVEPFDTELLVVPAINIRFGAWYLNQLLAKYRGHVVLAVASYNAGPRAVSKWVDAAGALSTDEFVEEIPYRETRHYVKRVLANLGVYHALYGGAPLWVPDSLPSDYLDNVEF
jgi:soluble lytic murein transglycosylase